MKLNKLYFRWSSRDTQKNTGLTGNESPLPGEMVRGRGQTKVIKRFDYGAAEGHSSENQVDLVNVNIVPETIKYEPTRLCFFYIGSDNSMFEHFIYHFESGYKEGNLLEASKLLQQLYLRNNKLPDVMFIDLPFNEDELKEFCDDLKYNLLLVNLPIIYHDRQLTKHQIGELNRLQLVDDIITIDSKEVNYYSKIMFLKQCKLYNQLFGPVKHQPVQRETMDLSMTVKRAVDIVIALTCILLLSPILLLIVFAIRLESKGPVFYTSLRAGKGFKVFRFYKFRSMVVNAENQVGSLTSHNQYGLSTDGPLFFKINHDPRITGIGKILRNTSADELPQLFNVLKGDMSIVGNRPLPIYEAVTLTTDEFVERFTAPAGITGLWQVNKRGKAEMSSEERINLDITYSRNYNFLYDLRIIVKTPMAIFQKSDV